MTTRTEARNILKRRMDNLYNAAVILSDAAIRALPDEEAGDHLLEAHNLLLDKRLELQLLYDLTED